MLNVKIHPAAEIFPMMGDAEYAELVEDIRKNGQRVSITYWNEMLLDGRNRLKACRELGIEPEAEELEERLMPDPVGWVLSNNLHRRHLSETQREVIAAKFANLKNGEAGNGRKVGGPNGPPTKSTDEAAEQLNVTSRSVKRAKAAIKGGCKELIAAMERDEVTSSLASKFVAAVPSKAKQAKIVKQGIKAIREAVKPKPKPKPEPSPEATPEIAPESDSPSEEEYEDVDDDDEETHEDPSRLAEARAVVMSLEPHELMLVAEWINDRLNDLGETK